MTSREDVVRSFIRGAASWRDLGALGIEVDFRGAECSVASRWNRMLVPEVTDIAEGFRRHRFDRDGLREWAMIMLAASGVIDLRALEGTAIGEVVLEALWGAAATGQIDERAMEALDGFS